MSGPSLGSRSCPVRTYQLSEEKVMARVEIETSEQQFGIIYLLQNPSFQETIIKIGVTTDLTKRMEDLYRTSGVPTPFTCYYAREVQNAKEIESKLHGGLRSRRINPKREFFDVDPEEAKKLLEIAPGRDVTPAKQNESEIGKKLARRSSFRLQDYGIGPGSTLVYVNDRSVTARVHEDGRAIVMEDDAPENMSGETYSLSGAARELVGYHVSGTDHWLYEGKTLNQIRGEHESSPE